MTELWSHHVGLVSSARRSARETRIFSSIREQQRCVKRPVTIVADESVMVVVGLGNHLVDLFLGHLRADVAHDEAELVGADVPVTVLVEDAERLLDLVLHRVRVLDLLRHHVQELRKVHRPAA